MPIEADIRDHDLLGPVFRQGFQEGFHEGFQEGLAEAALEGALTLLRIATTARFGSFPKELHERLSKMSITQLEDFSEPLCHAKTLDELLAGLNLNTVAHSDPRPNSIDQFHPPR